MTEKSRKEKIIIIQGDITEKECDAIVNAANNQLWMGGGVAGAIKRKGGEEIEKEAVSQGPIPIGDAVFTKAGKLKARYVIHAATMGTDFKTSAEAIRQATFNSLKRAEELKLKSIAFPALGTGVGGFPIEECAGIMIGQIHAFLKNAREIQEVSLVLGDERAHKIFCKKLEEIRVG